jgi:hypothetical protein
MTRRGLSRRQFLRGAGGYLLATPFLPSLLPFAAYSRSAQAATLSSSPKRFVAVWTPNGTLTRKWYPTQDPTTVLAPNVRTRSLLGTSDPISEILGPEVSSFRSKLTLVRGLDLMLGGHNTAGLLAANGGQGDGSYTSDSITMDQVLAASSKVYPGEPKRRMVHLSASSRVRPISYMKSGGYIVHAPYMYDPLIAFEKMFGATAGLSAPQIAQMKDYKLSVIDMVLEDYHRVMGSSRISAGDKSRLDAHVSHIRELERRVRGLAAEAACGPTSAPDSMTSINVMTSVSGAAHANYLKALTDLIVAGIRCDISRVYTLILTDRAATYSVLGVPGDHHGISHQVSLEGEERAAQIDQYLVQRFAELLRGLDGAVEDPATGRTYLDNTAILYSKEFAGTASTNHKADDMPVLLAGGGGGILSPGRYVDYRTIGEKVNSHYSSWKGVPYNQLLVSLLQGFGLSPAEYEQGGQAGFGTYRMGLASKYNLTDTGKRTPLPFLKV